MRPIGAWLGRLAVAGSCLAWAGCGRGDVPDPDSDSSAAAEQATKVVDRGGAPAPAAEAPAPEAAPAPAPAPAPMPAAGEAEKPAAAPAAPAEADKAPPALKGDASGTDELLRMSGTPAPSPATPPASGDAAAAPPAGQAPPAPGGPADGREERMRGMRPPGASPEAGAQAPAPSPGPGPGSPAIVPPAPGGRNGPGAADEARPGFGGVAGMPAPGGPGAGADLGGVAAMGNAAFNRPFTAVNAFLAALRAKDKDRLAQATARRSVTEAEEKHRKIFAAIIDQSISDEELDDMAKALDGYQVMQELPAKSTGRVGVIIRKQSGRGEFFQRTLTVRKEKEGWKVMDIANMYDFKASLPPMFGRGRGRRR